MLSLVRHRSAPPECESPSDQAARRDDMHQHVCEDVEVNDDDVGGESWPDYLERARARLAREDLPEEAGRLFETFRTAEDTSLIFASFANLFWKAACPGGESAGDAPWAGPEDVPHRRWRFPYEAIRLLLGGNRMAGNLWKLFDAKTARPEYSEAPCEGGPMEGRRAVVVGAGPCGLRAAIELRMLGAQVTVVDRRTTFTRINQLHIWSWCGEDMKALGARILEPPSRDFGANPDLLHVCIADLQKLLLKTALLLGAEIFLGVDFVATDWDEATGSWRAKLGPAFSSGAAGEGRAEAAASPASRESCVNGPTPNAPEWLDNVAVVIGANGFGSSVGEDLGMKVEETNQLRAEAAVGVICNFARQNGMAERKLRPFSLAKQFYLQHFKKAREECGADLENIVYVKSKASHYFVMTPTHRSLLDSGVVIDKMHKPMLEPANIDLSKLEQFVRRIAKYPYKGDQQPVLEAAEQDAQGKEVKFADRGPRLFDFSRMRRQADGLSFIAPPSGEDANHLLVGVVGDALMEPFWPEGLGIIRGFFSVLDACAAISEWAGGADQKTVTRFAECAFSQLKTVSAATRKQALRDNEKHYGLAPGSRYRRFAPGEPARHRPRQNAKTPSKDVGGG